MKSIESIQRSMTRVKTIIQHLLLLLLIFTFAGAMFFYIMESNYMKQYDTKIHTGVQKKAGA